MSIMFDKAANDLLRRIRLSIRNERMLSLAASRCQGTAEEVTYKLAQAHNFLALAQVSERVVVYKLNLENDPEALCMLSIDPTKYVPMQKDETEHVKVMVHLKVSVGKNSLDFDASQPKYQVQVISPTLTNHPYVEDKVQQMLKLSDLQSEANNLAMLLIATYATLSAPLDPSKKKDSLDIAAHDWWNHAAEPTPAKKPKLSMFGRLRSRH